MFMGKEVNVADWSNRYMQVAFSADGQHWGEPTKIGAGVKGDTHNNAIWVPELNRYVGITREAPDAPDPMWSSPTSPMTQ